MHNKCSNNYCCSPNFFAFHYGIFGYTLFRGVCCRFYPCICVAFVAVVNAILIMIMKFCWLHRQLPATPLCHPATSPFPFSIGSHSVCLHGSLSAHAAYTYYVTMSFCCNPETLQSGWWLVTGPLPPLKFIFKLHLFIYKSSAVWCAFLFAIPRICLPSKFSPSQGLSCVFTSPFCLLTFRHSFHFPN